jgi:hypothetical protein
MTKLFSYLESININETLEKIGKKIANTIRCDIHGNCVHFAELFVIAVAEEDDSLLDSFNVIEGYVDTKIGEGIEQEHTWIELKNKTKIDPTFEQFSTYDKNSKYITKRRRIYSGRKYYNDTIEDPRFSEKRKKHPERVFKITVYVDMDGVLADLDEEQKIFIKNNYIEIFKDKALENLSYLTQKEQIDILINIFNKKEKNITDEELKSIKTIYWEKFIEQRCFEKLKVMSQVKILSKTLKELKKENENLHVEILGSTGNPINHHIVAEQKKKWLDKHKVDIDIDFYRHNFVAGRKLKQHYATKNAILIDDTKENCQEFKNTGGYALHVDSNMSELMNKLKIYINKIKEDI